MTDRIDDHLRIDHERLNALWTRFRGLAVRPDAEACRLLEEFSTGLRRHIDFEEKQFFPSLRLSTNPPPDRAIDSLVIDHQVILEHLDLLRHTLEQGRAGEADPVAARLEIYLEGHNRDEEIGVYHDADRGMTAAEHQALIASFRSSSGSKMGRQ